MKKRMKKLAALCFAAAIADMMCLQTVCPVQAATEHWNDASQDSAAWEQYKAEWNTRSNDFEHVSLTPGVDETELNFAWYSRTIETPQVRFATSKEGLEKAAATIGNQKKVVLSNADNQAVVEGYYSNKVTIKGLEENTTYYYQVYRDGEWQEPKTYQTNSFHNFSFAYVGDPQIGACKKQVSTEGEKMISTADRFGEHNLAARNDAYNWNQTLNQMLATHSDLSFLVSAGDQVNASNNEVEYAGYLGADALASLPVATTIGNHDSTSENYNYHYNNPNTQDAADEAYRAGATLAGTDYYYTYGDVLFIVLDTNNYNCATHENVMKKAVAENPDAKWRVVTFHQDIYGSGYDHSDSDGMVLRTQLTPLMDRYDIDVVLQGHDHTYSRSYQLTGDGKEHNAYDKNNFSSATDFLEQNLCYSIQSDAVSGTVVDPKGTVYLEANSATGSKFYNLIPTQQDYISERSQTWTPSYSVIDVTDHSFTVTTYDATTNARLAGSSPYTIIKEADKRSLREAIQDAQEKAEDTKRYDAESIRALNRAIARAEKVAEDPQATKEAIANESAALAKAVAGLTEKAQQQIKVKAAFQKALHDKQFALKAKANGALSYYSNNEQVAKVDKNGTVKLKGVGKATITILAQETKDSRATSQKVTILVTPDPTELKSITSKQANTAKISWQKQKEISGYEIHYASDRNFKKDAKVKKVDAHTSAIELKNLTSKRSCYVKVRAYKTEHGVKLYGAYSKIKCVKVK